MGSLFCRAGLQVNSEMYEEMCPAMVARQYKDPPVLIGDEMTEYVVRRITPTETEVLQGFPKGWTDVEVNGRKATDTARYKATGNSMAVPVIRWIGERIQAVEVLG